MLILKDIVKRYDAAGKIVPALNGISIAFRDREFVAVLGQSGCGKTTLLNVIGGLDRATSGDISVDGVGMKDFSDRDLDAYRNSRIGFVFQSYDLIPHQTVLENVALGLTIAGMKRRERIARAKAALEKVGLGDELDKLPNQLSGGQQQRVSIARAIVNEPDILLADEPTGALDSATGLQIAELLKEISKTRLVITVTHNAELAERFATRIVRLSDGAVTSDSDPYAPERDTKPEGGKRGVSGMGFFTASRLSAANLLSKLKRTVLVALAGAIGIIGVSSVLSVSAGVSDFIDGFQDDMLSGNPIEISRSGIDITSLIDNAPISVKAKAIEYGKWVNVNSIVEYLIENERAFDELFIKNEFGEDYINYVKSMPSEYCRGILADYGIEVTANIYTDFKAFDDPAPEFEKYNLWFSDAATTETYKAILEKSEYGDYASYIVGLATGFREGISDGGYILSQYDLLAGNLPEKSTDILVVLNDDEQLNDVLLAQLGYYTEEEFCHIAAGDGEYRSRFSYDEITKKRFTWYPNDAVYTDLSFTIGDSVVQKYGYACLEDDVKGEGIELSVCGIVKPKSGLSYGVLKLGFIYTEELARYMISRNADSVIAKNIREHGEIRSLELQNELKNLYGTDCIGIFCRLEYACPDLGAGTYTEAEGDDARLTFIGRTNSGTRNTIMSLLSSGGITVSSGTESMIGAISESRVMDLNGVGGTYLPERLKIYPESFESKGSVTDYLDAWNGDGDVTFYVFDAGADRFERKDAAVKTLSADERSVVKPTDQVGPIISMMKSVTDAVTYALVAFTALALVVSTVMIGILTYISVLERTKEIGVIRALGGSRRDVAFLFTAEAGMIGFAGGVFGVLTTFLLTIAGNAAVKSLSGGNIAAIARLSPAVAASMIAVSVLLTLISGLLPARTAAKKDPVTALRTE